MKRHQRASFPALSSWVLIHFQRFMSALYKFQTERQISMPKYGEIPLVPKKKTTLRAFWYNITLHTDCRSSICNSSEIKHGRTDIKLP